MNMTQENFSFDKTTAPGGSRSVATARVGTAATERRPPSLPQRKYPSKNSVVLGQDKTALLFVSVNANNRQSVFANADAVRCILAAWQKADAWSVGRYMIMPDHLHFFCSPRLSPMVDFHKWMAYWKSLVARHFPVWHELPLWQTNCWDLQLRSQDSYDEKWHYVRNNPVRKGLVSESDEWPFQGCLNILEWRA